MRGSEYERLQDYDEASEWPEYLREYGADVESGYVFADPQEETSTHVCLYECTGLAFKSLCEKFQVSGLMPGPFYFGLEDSADTVFDWKIVPVSKGYLTFDVVLGPIEVQVCPLEALTYEISKSDPLSLCNVVVAQSDAIDSMTWEAGQLFDVPAGYAIRFERPIDLYVVYSFYTTDFQIDFENIFDKEKGVFLSKDHIDPNLLSGTQEKGMIPEWFEQAQALMTSLDALPQGAAHQNKKEEKNINSFSELMNLHSHPSSLTDKQVTTLKNLLPLLKITIERATRDFDTFRPMRDRILDFLDHRDERIERAKSIIGEERTAAIVAKIDGLIAGKRQKLYDLSDRELLGLRYGFRLSQGRLFCKELNRLEKKVGTRRGRKKKPQQEKEKTEPHDINDDRRRALRTGRVKGIKRKVESKFASVEPKYSAALAKLPPSKSAYVNMMQSYIDRSRLSDEYFESEGKAQLDKMLQDVSNIQPEKEEKEEKDLEPPKKQQHAASFVAHPEQDHGIVTFDEKALLVALYHNQESTNRKLLDLWYTGNYVELATQLPTCLPIYEAAFTENGKIVRLGQRFNTFQEAMATAQRLCPEGYQPHVIKDKND